MNSTETDTPYDVSTNTMQKTINASDSQNSAPTSSTITSDITQMTENSTLPNSSSHYMEYITLVWLDSANSVSEENIENSISRLMHLVNSVKRFAVLDDCVNFIVSNSDIQIFMIVSHEFCQRITLMVQELAQVQSIYILCDDNSKYEYWIKQYKKIKGLYANIEPIYHALRRDIRQLNNSMIPISIIAPSPTTNLDELDQSFMYSRLLKESFLEMSYDNNSKKEFIEYCRAHYVNNDNESRKLDQFENKYEPSSAIWWYTREYFIYALLNSALRCQNTTILLKMGYFFYAIYMNRYNKYTQSQRIGLI